MNKRLLFLALASLLPLPAAAAQSPQALLGEIAVSEDEAILDLRTDAETLWVLLGLTLHEAGLELPADAVTDAWLLVGDLWLRAEPLPYKHGGWYRVRVRVADFRSDAQRERARALLARLGTLLTERVAAERTLAALAAEQARAEVDLAAATFAGDRWYGTDVVYRTSFIWLPAWSLGWGPCSPWQAGWWWDYGLDHAWPWTGWYFGSFWSPYGYGHHGHGGYAHHGYGYGYGYGFGHHGFGYHHGAHCGCGFCSTTVVIHDDDDHHHHDGDDDDDPGGGGGGGPGGGNDDGGLMSTPRLVPRTVARTDRRVGGWTTGSQGGGKADSDAGSRSSRKRPRPVDPGSPTLTRRPLLPPIVVTTTKKRVLGKGNRSDPRVSSRGSKRRGAPDAGHRSSRTRPIVSSSGGRRSTPMPSLPQPTYRTSGRTFVPAEPAFPAPTSSNRGATSGRNLGPSAPATSSRSRTPGPTSPRAGSTGSTGSRRSAGPSRPTASPTRPSAPSNRSSTRAAPGSSGPSPRPGARAPAPRPSKPSARPSSSRRGSKARSTSGNRTSSRGQKSVKRRKRTVRKP